MRAVLRAWGVTDRTVWVADSFEGLPVKDPENYPADATAMPLHEFKRPCRAAVTDFRERRGISDPIETADSTGVCWQRSG